MYAAKHHPEAIPVLVAKGADVSTKDDSGWTPLMYAAECNPEAIPTLVAEGADVNERDEKGLTLLHRTVERGIRGEDVTGTIIALVEAGADTNILFDRKTLFECAFEIDFPGKRGYLTPKLFSTISDIDENDLKCVRNFVEEKTNSRHKQIFLNIFDYAKDSGNIDYNLPLFVKSLFEKDGFNGINAVDIVSKFAGDADVRATAVEMYCMAMDFKKNLEEALEKASFKYSPADESRAFLKESYEKVLEQKERRREGLDECGFRDILKVREIAVENTIPDVWKRVFEAELDAAKFSVDSIDFVKEAAGKLLEKCLGDVTANGAFPVTPETIRCALERAEEMVKEMLADAAKTLGNTPDTPANIVLDDDYEPPPL